MSQIIPTINVQEESEFIKRLNALDNITSLAQIDIADGKFTAWKSWADPEKIFNFKTNCQYELHLMVEKPFEELKKWYHLTNIRRAVFHVESFESINLEIFHKTIDFDYEVCFALNPNTKIDVLKNILPNLEYVMFLGVNPGKSGQKFQKKILEKIKSLKAAHKHIKIEIDGGVDEENFGTILKAGADFVCMGSGIFNNKGTPAENLRFFEEMIP